jgi:exosortase A-associated hydrolase 1
MNERAVTFGCEGETLVGVLHPAPAPAARGVLIVVGGPQYRVGSHRQFLLLARHLARAGVPVFRFDYRGMGDSSGAARTFEDIGADLRSATDRFFAEVPALQEVVIWALCDAASATLFYASHERRIAGIALLNPWVRTEQGAARAYLRHYYLERIIQPQFWRKIASGEFSVRQAAAGLTGIVRGAVGGKTAPAGAASQPPAAPAAAGDLPARMEEGLRRFRGRVLLILSGNDLTAQEFKDVAGGSRGWRRLLAAARVARCDLADANHTFSRREWRNQVARWTEDWLKSW